MKYKVVDKYRLCEFIMGIVLLITMIAGGLIRLKSIVLPVKADNIDTITTIPVEQSTVDIYENMPKYNLTLDEELQRYIWKLCYDNIVSYELIITMLYQESKFNPKAVNKNIANRGGERKVTSVDKGIAQINSRYQDEYANLAGISTEEFNPYNPNHGILACVSAIKFLREYWINQGISSEEDLWYYTIGAYNRGIQGFKSYIKRTGKLSTSYHEAIYEYKTQLEEFGCFIEK